MLIRAGITALRGNTVNIEMRASEITTICNQLQRVITELETNAIDQIDKIENIQFYREGKAKATIEAYTSANKKIIEMLEHYQRAQTLIIDVLEQMMRTDQEIATKIIESLEM